MKEILTGFLIELNEKGLINNHDFDFEKEAEKYNSKIQRRENCDPPTTFEKSKLPIEIRYSYCKTTELYQKIQMYEMGLINKTDFINGIYAIEDSYTRM